MRHIIPISGKDSAATAIVQRELQPTLDYEYMFNSTDAELPAVHDWLARMSRYLDAEIHYIGQSLADEIDRQGILPSPLVRFCTRECKIKPMESWLAGESATVYYGLRADEPQRVGYTSKKGASITPSYPLRTMGLGLPGVWRILEDRDLLPPFLEWHALTAAVKAQMGDYFHVAQSLHPWEYRYLFSWRTREFNCSFCFFMRQYEFIGLLENYPALFWAAVEMEETTGGDNYTLLRTPLRELAERREEILEKRVRQVVKILRRKMQYSLFPLPEADELAATSCGLFCGK